MAVGVSPLEGLRIGCRWGLGLVECEIHLRTLSPVVRTGRSANRVEGFGRIQEGRAGGGRETKEVGGWNRNGCGSQADQGATAKTPEPRGMTSFRNLK